MRVLLSWFLVVSLNVTALLFAVADNPILHVTEFEEIDRLGIGAIYDLEFHPDGHTLAVGTNTGLYLYSVPELEQISNFNLWDKSVSELTWSPDGRWLVYVSDRNIFRWDSTTRETTVLVENIDSAKLDWSPDNTQLAALEFPSRSSTRLCT